MRDYIHAEAETKEAGWYRYRARARLGMTGLWQIGGRNKIRDFDEWVRMALDYIDHWSLGLDFKILLKTIPVVVLGVGAV